MTSTRGGMRENSSVLHRHKKMRTHTCEWCGKKYETIQKVGKFCSEAHKQRAKRALFAMRTRKRLTDLARKGRDFRPYIGVDDEHARLNDNVKKVEKADE